MNRNFVAAKFFQNKIMHISYIFIKYPNEWNLDFHR